MGAGHRYAEGKRRGRLGDKFSKGRSMQRVLGEQEGDACPRGSDLSERPRSLLWGVRR